MADDSEPVWGKTSPASFEVPGFDQCIFPVAGEWSCDGSIREVSRSVPWVNGEQLDETGCAADVHQVVAVFFNDLMDEEGIGTTPQLYPDRLELLIRIFKSRQTGTLNLPLMRNIRAKATRWRRIATDDKREYEILQITFKEDNEAKLDAPKAAGVTAHVSLSLQMQDAQFEAERAGLGGAQWEDLTLLASQLEAALNAPAEMRENVSQKAHRIVSACDTVLTAVDRNEQEVGFRDPATAVAYRALWAFRNLVAASEEQAREGRPDIVVLTTKLATNIWEFAISLGKDPQELIDLNPQIEDLNDIDPGTPVNAPK
jgi:hypothetical protein